jgi:hypothetical protein
VGIIQPPPLFFALDIRFIDRRRTNGAPGHSEMSVAEGKVSKPPLLVFVTNVNSSLPLRRPTAQPQTQEVQSGIRRRTLTRAAARRPAEERA